MIQRRKCRMMADQHIIPDLNTTLILHGAAGIDKYIFTNMNILSAIGVKRRNEPQGFIDWGICELGK